MRGGVILAPLSHALERARPVTCPPASSPPSPRPQLGLTAEAKRYESIPQMLDDVAPAWQAVRCRSGRRARAPARAVLPLTPCLSPQNFAESLAAKLGALASAQAAST